MAKIKLGLCIILQFCYLLCFFGLIVDCTDTDDGSSDSDQSQNPSTEEDSELSLVLQRFAQIVGQRNREHGKVIEEMKEQIQSLQSAQESRDAEVKSLKKELDQLKNQISEDHGVWMLTPPLRGPPGKDGKPGDKGEPGPIDPRSLQNCRDVTEFLPTPQSKKQTIYPHGNTNKKVEVLCDFETDGGGWTIIQKRSSGPKQEFSQNWTQYKNGFGSLEGNFWLGLENIRALTQNGDQELRIQLEDFEGSRKYAKYSSFSISDASDFYRLSLSGFSGDAGDSILSDNGMKFSTIDKDNDGYSGASCSALYGSSGWWFGGCTVSALNGFYFEEGETATIHQGVTWHSWKGYSTSLAKTEMKIRTRK